LTTLLTVLTLGATLLGTSTQLMTQTSQRAVEIAASRLPPEQVQATAYTVRISAADARSVAADTRALLTSSVAPFTATTAIRASSPMHKLPMASNDDRGLLSEAYLSGVENLPDAAGLREGRWPKASRTAGAALETVLFDSTARLLGLTVGSRVHLGPQVGRAPAPAVDVVVVGLIRPRPASGWDRDPLGGAGFDPHPADVAYAAQVDAYGPFLVTLDDLLNSGSSLDRLEVTARPDLSDPTGHDLNQLTDSLLGADRKLTGTLGGRTEFDRVTSPIPGVLLDARRQQELIASSVLAFALIGLVLTAIALALAGRLVTAERADERALLTSLGLSRGQFALVAIVEATLLAGLAAALSIPLSTALHVTLTRLPPLADAGLTARPVVTPVQVLAVVCGALTLAILHIGLAVRRVPDSGDRRSRRELLARSGIDVLLCGLAIVGWWQLRAQPAAAGSRADAVRVLAPALILAASIALALRLVPPVLSRAERLATRARGFVWPLAVFQAARRPQAFAAALLIGLACAAATFGTAFGATWTASQHDQADLATGTDLAIALSAPPAAGQSARIGAATGGTITPVVERNVAVGQYLGEVDDAPRMVAIDTRRAGRVMRGRSDDGWAEVVGPVVPKSAVTGPELPRSATPMLTGTATGGSAVVVTPQLLLQDATGLRTACSGPPIVLDGRPYPVPGCATADGLRLVAVALPVTRYERGLVFSRVDVTLSLPGGDTFPAGWTVRSAAPLSGQVSGAAVTSLGARLRVSAGVAFTDPLALSRVLVATAFRDPGPVPLVVSARFARDVKAHPGSVLSLGFGSTAIIAVVTGVVPRIPSAPGAPAVLADVDTLTRALALHGDFDSSVTGWWVGEPRAGATANVDALHLGEVTTRTAEITRLTSGPLRASLPATFRVLVAASVLLLLGGVVLYVVYDVRQRALEVARLRGLGLSRRHLRAMLLGEHAVVLLPVLVLGAVVGAAANWVLAPLMVRSDTGAVAVPPAATQWPWAAGTALLAVLIVGGGLAVAAAVTIQARRADAAHLRVAS
ncbi:FtsX-like permease family protein, partial [Cryptosporangium sp. NPDC051539]|uniref:FtsX-like permease family protein n=1 Tax=Cryptosporangium sp. NPDC051539 TaxID=3363962 RepID=UPI0037A50DA3